MSEEKLIEYVYYYPPSTLNPNNIVSISLDQYGMVNVTFNPGPWTFLTAAPLYLFSGPISINMTPEAFTNWYTNNLAEIQNSSNYSMLSQFYQQLMSPVGNYSNQEEATAALVLQNGFIWLPYSEWPVDKNSSILGDIANVFNANYEFLGYNTNNLYALVNPNVSTAPGIVPNLAASIPWYVYVILIVGGILLLFSWMSRNAVFRGAGEVQEIRIKGEQKRILKEQRERLEEQKEREQKEKESRKTKK